VFVLFFLNICDLFLDKIVTSSYFFIFIGYWLDMEIYVRVLVRSNIARRQKRNINYAPDRVHIDGAVLKPRNCKMLTFQETQKTRF